MAFLLGLFSSKEEDYKVSAGKLLKKEDSLLLDSLDSIENSYVISIVGDARKGKSTFLNLLINYLTKENKEYFKVQSSLEHCTVGMDYLKLENSKSNIIFIDCQGLNYEDSSNDSKYLLFLYTISNIVIFNERSIINNTMFNTFQPMALFMNSFESVNNNNNILYVRISDYDLEDDSNNLYEKLFNKMDDQYDNVRESMIKLFNKIVIKDTYSLDRSEKKLLKSENYSKFLENENNFLNVIKDIYEELKDLDMINIDLVKLVDLLNNNKKIDFKKLDIYTLNTEKEIKDFIDEEIYDKFDFIERNNLSYPFVIDGTIECNNKIEELKNEIKNKNKLFESQFSKVPDNLKNMYYKLIKEVNEFLKMIYLKNKKISNNYIDPIYIINENKITEEYNNVIYYDIDVKYNILDEFEKKVNLYITYKDYVKKLYDIMKNLGNNFVKIKGKNDKLVNKFNIKLNKILECFNIEMIKKINLGNYPKNKLELENMIVLNINESLPLLELYHNDKELKNIEDFKHKKNHDILIGNKDKKINELKFNILSKLDKYYEELCENLVSRLSMEFCYNYQENIIGEIDGDLNMLLESEIVKDSNIKFVKICLLKTYNVNIEYIFEKTMFERLCIKIGVIYLFDDDILYDYRDLKNVYFENPVLYDSLLEIQKYIYKNYGVDIDREDLLNEVNNMEDIDE